MEFYSLPDVLIRKKRMSFTVLGQEKKNRLVIAENELKAKELYEDLKFYYPDVFIIRRGI